jgi:hypothetical protein
VSRYTLGETLLSLEATEDRFHLFVRFRMDGVSERNHWLYTQFPATAHFYHLDSFCNDLY